MLDYFDEEELSETVGKGSRLTVINQLRPELRKPSMDL